MCVAVVLLSLSRLFAVGTKGAAFCTGSYVVVMRYECEGGSRRCCLQVPRHNAAESQRSQSLRRDVEGKWGFIYFFSLKGLHYSKVM